MPRAEERRRRQRRTRCVECDFMFEYTPADSCPAPNTCETCTRKLEAAWKDGRPLPRIERRV